jgi:hypothetical protein
LGGSEVQRFRGSKVKGSKVLGSEVWMLMAEWLKG